MEWMMTLLTGLGLFVLLAPVLALLFTVFVLVPLAHLAPAAAAVARRGFRCPVTKRRVHATFLTAPGVDRPLDVVECSEFDPEPVTCKKGCLALATVKPASSPMVPRYALIADGVACRQDAPHEDGHDADRSRAAAVTA
jgi:hypothetical protein